MIRQLYPLTGIKAYHMTGKRVIDSEMQFRKDGVNMGLPMLSEYEIWRTDVDNIRAAKKFWRNYNGRTEDFFEREQGSN